MKTTRAKSQPKDNENKSIHETLAAYLCVRDLIMYLPLSETLIWRKVRNHSFPQPIKLSAGVTAWRTADILEWMQEVEGNSALATTGDTQ